MRSALGEFDRIRELLAAAGHPWTRPRATVLRVLVGAPTPLRAEEIHARLRRASARGSINLSSVYRTLNLLRMLRVVRPVQLGHGAQRYELAEGYRAHHHHFVCEDCGRIEDVRHCPLEGRDLGQGVRGHHLELFGLCRVCTGEESEGHVRV